MTVAAACGAAPIPARADTVFTPFIGQSFATRKDAAKVTTIGASMASTVRGVFGLELDFGRTSKAAGSAAFADNTRVTMLMGNAVLGLPFGRFRPYAIGGLGWLRREVLGGGETVRSAGLGLDVGAGFLGFFSNSVGVRLDLRYVRSLTADDIETLRLPGRLGLGDFLIEDLSFWRSSVGLALRF